MSDSFANSITGESCPECHRKRVVPRWMYLSNARFCLHCHAVWEGPDAREPAKDVAVTTDPNHAEGMR